MNLLYEKVYRKKQEQYRQDGNLQELNTFITKAHEFQFNVAAKKSQEREYCKWLNEQLCS